MTTDTELRELLAAATPGPWEAGERWIFTSPIYDDTTALANVLGDRYADPDRMQAEIERGRVNTALIVAVVNALPGLLDRIKQAEKERDSAQEHLAYHLADYQLNSEPTGDLAVDMAAWARRQRDRADRAEAEVARLREGIRALAIGWDQVASTDRDIESKTLRAVAETLRSLLQEGE